MPNQAIIARNSPNAVHAATTTGAGTSAGMASDIEMAPTTATPPRATVARAGRWRSWALIQVFIGRFSPQLSLTLGHECSTTRGLGPISGVEAIAPKVEELRVLRQHDAIAGGAPRRIEDLGISPGIVEDIVLRRVVHETQITMAALGGSSLHRGRNRRGSRSSDLRDRKLVRVPGRGRAGLCRRADGGRPGGVPRPVTGVPLQRGDAGVARFVHRARSSPTPEGRHRPGTSDPGPLRSRGEPRDDRGVRARGSQRGGAVPLRTSRDRQDIVWPPGWSGPSTTPSSSRTPSRSTDSSSPCSTRPCTKWSTPRPPSDQRPPLRVVQATIGRHRR